MESKEPDPLLTEKNLRAHRIVLIPAYNEERFIGSLVLQARKVAATVIVVDDGSQDDTARIARDAGAELVGHETNKGKAAALNSGFFYVRLMKQEMKDEMLAVVTMDGDSQHSCRDIPGMTAPIFAREADIVIGSRFLEVKNRIPRWRIFGQHALTAVTNLSSGFHVTDSQSGFRAFSRRALYALDFESAGFSVESEMQFMAHEKHLRVVEVPIHALYEDPAKRNPVRQGLEVLNGIIKFTGQYRPLLFFSVPGVSLLLFGVGWGAVVVNRFYESGQLAVGYALICVLLSVLGMILISTGFMLHSVRGLLIDLLRVKGMKKPR